MGIYDNARALAAAKAEREKAYTYWGDHAAEVEKQGWYPETGIDPKTGKATFVTDYDAPFNTIRIPGEKEYGHVAIIGGKEGKFDIAVRKKSGEISSYIYQNASPETVQNWIRNPAGTIAHRVADLPADQKVVLK